MKVCLVGYGSSNKEMVQFLTEGGNTVFVSNNKPLRPEDIKFLSEKGIMYEEEHSSLLENSDLAVVSPGVPPNSSASKIISEKNMRFTTEVEYAWMTIKRANPACIFVGITGTDGKSTTTSLIGHLLREAGYSTFVGGNIGIPLITAPMNLQFYVVEISSFQLYWGKRLCPEVSVLLNLAPDHLNWHTSLEEYYGCKISMIDNTLSSGGLAIVNQNIKNAMYNGKTIHFSGEMLENGYVNFEDRRIKVMNDFLNLKIYSEDTVSAVIACLNLGISENLIEQGLKSFKPLSHRIELCGNVNGISFYDDSKATNVHSAYNAYLSFRGKGYAALLNGIPKNEDLTELIEEVRNFSKITLVFGAMTEEVKKYPLDEKFVFCNNMEEAVKIGMNALSPGDSIIMSPAGASFDLYQDYKERGNHFKNIAHRLGGDS